VGYEVSLQVVAFIAGMDIQWSLHSCNFDVLSGFVTVRWIYFIIRCNNTVNEPQLLVKGKCLQ
jgi:hypothetical protein